MATSMWSRREERREQRRRRLARRWDDDDWTPWPSPDTTHQFFDLAVGDVNHDGWLDILAGGENIGPQVWLGDGAGGWTLSTTNLPTTGSYFRSQFGHIDHDGNLDILATIPGSGLQMWAAAEAAPPTISNIQPGGWISTTQSPTVMRECASIPDRASARPRGCIASRRMAERRGAHSRPRRSAARMARPARKASPPLSVPFNQDSGTQNKIEFRASDMVGNLGTAQATIKIDTMPPTAPSFLLSPDHTVNVWSNINAIGVEWGGATDATSGVYAYSVLFDQNPTTLPPPVVNAFGGLFTSSALADGGNWYAHVRTRRCGGQLVDVGQASRPVQDRYDAADESDQRQQHRSHAGRLVGRSDDLHDLVGRDG